MTATVGTLAAVVCRVTSVDMFCFVVLHVCVSTALIPPPPPQEMPNATSVFISRGPYVQSGSPQLHDIVRMRPRSTG
jgi:hypothetical protein